MAAIIRIKRSTGTAAPSSLKFGELAYTAGNTPQLPFDGSSKGDRLFVGAGSADSNGDATSIEVIGGKYFTDMLDHQPGVLTHTSAIITDDQSKIDRLLVNNTVIDSNGVSSTNPTLILAGDTNISVDSQQIKNLADPTLNQDAATKYYVDSHIGAVTIDLVTDSGSRHILNLVDSDLTILGNSPIKTQIDRHQIYISLDSSGVTAGSYGSQTQIPVFSVDSHGLIDSASTVNVATELTVKADSGSDLSISLLDSSLSIVGGTNIGSIIGDSNTVTLNLDSNVLGLASLTVDNIKIDGNEISTTDSSGILYLNPWPSNDSGEVIIRGSLRVDGTTTTFNSTTLTVNDKNIVLADSAVDSTAADGAGITVAGANATITYDATGDKWIFNKAPHYNDERLLTNTDSAYLKSVIDSDYMDSLLSDNYLDSAEAQSIIDSNFQNLSQNIIPDSDEAYDLGSPTKKFKDLYLSGTTLTIGNISISDSSGQISFRDSDGNVVSISTLEPQILAIVDSSYVNARLDTLSFLDSAEAVSLIDSHVDSAYVNARLDTSLFLDSGEVILLVDSNYVNARLDTSLFLDSGEAIQLIDSSHVQARQITYNTSDFLDSSTVELVVDSDYVNARLDTSSFLDSSEAIQLVDSAYVQARQITYNTSDFLDSSSVTLVVDSDYVNARVDLTNSLDSAEAIALIDSAYVQARQITYNTSNFTDSAFVTGLPVSTFDNDRKYLDSTSGQELFDSDYIQYRARAGMVAGTGVTYDSHTGVISIGQEVETSSNVSFARIIGDSAVLDGINFNPRTSEHSTAAGTLYYDSDPQQGLTFIPNTNEGNPDIRLNLGQEHVLYVHNQSGALIENGSLVYIAGVAHGSHPSVAKAQANDVNTYKAVGMATMDIADDGHGYITQFGIVNGINTDGLVAGGSLFLSADSAGKFVTTEPGGSNYPYRVGWALTIDSAVGRALIRIDAETADNVRVTNSIIVDEKITADSADLNLINLQPDLFTDVDIPNNIPWPRREGDVFYFSGPDALTYSNPSMNVKLGQDEIVRVYNNSGSDIAKGKVVYITGAANDFPSIALAQSDDFNTVYNTIGLTGHAIANGQFGFVVQRGLYGGLNTAGFTVGSRVHVSPDSAGELVDFSPGFPNFPYEVGTVLIADSAGGGNVGGCIQVEVKAETFESLRVQGDGRFGGDVTISGNLNILGTETKTTVANLNVSDNFIYIGAGDTISTLHSGTGANDGLFKDYYEGDSDIWYFVNIYDADSANGGDLIRLHQGDSAQAFDNGTTTAINFDSDGGSTTLDLSVDRTLLPIRNNIKITFETVGGHDSGDYWYGLASPVNQDLGIVGNYNLPDAPYSHAGFFRDASDQKFKVFNKYDPEVEGDINTTDPSFELGTMVANTFEGNLTGDVTGNADTATLLETSRNIGLNGDITSDSVGFNGGSNITLSTTINDGAITNAKIANSAAIVDTKLDTISTAGKVQNSATTATSANTASAIVSRDASGNFSAGNITATVTGTVSDISNHSTTDLSEGDNLYYTTARHDSDTLAQVDSAYVQARQLNFDNLLDSAEVIDLVDSAYVQLRQITYNTSNFTDSAYVTGLPISTFDNDRKYFDSNSATAFVDASYVQSRQITYNTSDFLDSSSVTLVVDAAYVQARQTSYNTADFTDSAFVTGLPISTFDNDRKYLDSNAATVFTTDLIDSAYITARAGAGTDSAAVIALIDSDYINSRSTGLQLISDSGDLSWQRVYSFATTDPVNGSLAIQHKIVLLDSVGTEKFANVPTVGTLTDSIGDIGNVNVTGGNVPTDGQTLVWDNANSYWKPGAAAGGGGLDSALATQLIDATYINSLNFTDSSYVTGLPVSTFDNDRKYLDSNSAGTFIDSDYVLGKMGMTGDANGNLTLINNRDITTGALTVADSGTPVSINSTNSTTSKIEFQDNGTIRGYLGASTSSVLDIGDSAASTLVSVDVGGNVLPAANGTQDLGSSSLRWQNLYTSDLNLSNGIGDYTVVEGEEDLFLYNNKSGKVFKFALIEVDPNEATPKIEDLKNDN